MAEKAASDKPGGSGKGSKSKGPDNDMTRLVERIKKPEDLLSGDWLQGMSDRELVLAVMSLILELQSRVGGSFPLTRTDSLNPSPHPFTIDREELKAATQKFVRLPRGAKKKEGAVAWRFILISSNPNHRPLAVEILDEAVVGRAVEGDDPPDLDLHSHDAAVLGVSRRHALLRPSQTALLLVDEDSTNGTFRNEQQLPAGEPQELHDEDTISFGQLHFKIMFVSQPGKKADA